MPVAVIKASIQGLAELHGGAGKLKGILSLWLSELCFKVLSLLMVVLLLLLVLLLLVLAWYCRHVIRCVAGNFSL